VEEKVMAAQTHFLKAEGSKLLNAIAEVNLVINLKKRDVLHYKELIEAHKVYYRRERRAKNYDRYIKEQKKWENWNNPDIPIDEIEKLFHFIRSWDQWFQGDAEIFQGIYKEIFPLIEKLRNERIENADFNREDLKITVRDIFEKIAYCTPMGRLGRYESTDASKILHTILPHFFVMWDDAIKDALVNGKNDGETYAFEFLPMMQQELIEAIETCRTEKESG
jgi:hypothetical protein